MDEEKDKEKKTFMENAQGFLGSWKDDYAKKNKEILDRKQKRDEEAEKEHQEFLKNLEAIKGDLKANAEKLATTLKTEFEGFTDALKRGSATVYEKFQLQKHFEEFKGFLQKAGKVGAEKYNELTSKIEQNLTSTESKVLKAEPPKTQNQEFEMIMKQAEELLQKDTNEKTNEIDENHAKVNQLFKDLDKE
jgi:ElaB/YqjD/DUF883 family membrane-anchored ribosome-binding protein